MQTTFIHYPFGWNGTRITDKVTGWAIATDITLVLGFTLIQGKQSFATDECIIRRTLPSYWDGVEPLEEEYFDLDNSVWYEEPFVPMTDAEMDEIPF